MSWLLNTACAVVILAGSITFATIGGRHVSFVDGVRPAHLAGQPRPTGMAASLI